MIGSEIRLSICVPTYNRIGFLRESLAVLLPQAQLNGVEVCISDNCSVDGTAQYLLEISKQFPLLRYSAQKSNVGIDRNMVAAISMGRGAYLYPLGDDDLLPEGAVARILEEVSSGADAIILNGWHTDPVLSPKFQHLRPWFQGRVFTAPDEAFRFLWDKMPFGSFVASRDCFRSDYFEKYIGTSHAYAGAVWEGIADKYREAGQCKMTCSSTPSVLLRGGQKTWSSNTALIMLCEIPMWFDIVGETKEYSLVSQDVRVAYLKRQTTWLSLLRFRAMGQLQKGMVDILGRKCSTEQKRNLGLIARVPKGLACFVGWVVAVMIKELNTIRGR